ncbi:MAG: hypothetical protein GX591_18430, partial [Planctomycetes bacterium]|nr:hypothetical protein [Planctomycetota bacterium]
DDVYRGSRTEWHPDFHQAFAPSPDWCENMIMYNVKAFNCRAQGFFGHRLRNSAFVNVVYEKSADAYASQYDDLLVNDLWMHVTLVDQTWHWRNDVPLDADACGVYNCVFGSMDILDGADTSGIEIDYNHFSGTSSMGTHKTTGDPQFVNPSADNYELSSNSPAYHTGKYLQCVPADVDGVPYNTSGRNKGCFASGTQQSNQPPVADAGDDQTATDTDGNGWHNFTFDGTGSSDSDGTIVSYVWEYNGNPLATGATPVVGVNLGAHTFELIVTDDDSATDTDSVVITLEEWSVTSSTAWQNFSMTSQSGRFLFEFDAVPNAGDINAVTGVSYGQADTWSEVACIVRFTEAGVIDVRNGGAYDADATLYYSSGATYRVAMTIDVPSHTYSVTVTPEGQSAVTLATDYAFRTEQASVSSLDNWVLNATYAGDSHTVSNVDVTVLNSPPVANAGSDQNVTDSDGNGSQSATLNGTGSSDSDGTIVSHIWKEGLSQIATGAQPSVTLDVGVHAIDLTVTDDDNDTDSDSVVVTVVSRTLTSSSDWPASALPSQTDVFTVEFDMTPSVQGMNGVTGLSYGAADWWDELACIVRFTEANVIEARNGGTYGADATVSYTAQTVYHVRMVVDVPYHTYSVYVTPDGGSEVALATDYAFRTEQQSVSSLDNWTLNETQQTGTHTVGNLTITD